MTVKEKTLPRPFTCAHSSLPLLHSTQIGRGQKIQEPQSLHVCIMSLPDLAPSQNGWLTGVISGRGFRMSFDSSAIMKNPFVLLYLKVFAACANLLKNVQHSGNTFSAQTASEIQKFPLLYPPPRGAGEEQRWGSKLRTKLTKGSDTFDYKVRALG